MAPLLIEMVMDDDEDVYMKVAQPYDMPVKKVSMWIKEGDLIRSSTNVERLDKLKPGVYKASYNRDLGYVCQVVDVKMDEIFVFSDNKTQEILDEISNFWSKKDLYAENKLMHKRGILLEGGPGTSKSSTISLLSQEIIKMGGVVFLISSEGAFIQYLEFLTNHFRHIEPDTPIITVIEDIDTFNDTEIQLLDFLDGKANIEHHVVITTTNNSEEISDCILRPSRIDLRVEFSNPSEKVRKEYLSKKGVTGEDLDKMAELADEFSFADLKELFISVTLLDYSIEDAVYKIAHPLEKRNYKHTKLGKTKIGF